MRQDSEGYEQLESCYRRMKDVLGRGIEPFESVKLIEDYRRFWKPKNEIKVILLAESHVFTTDEDRKLELVSLSDLAGYPKEYAKFVYCLGYGERELTKGPGHPERDGTPQFWKILLSCTKLINSNADFAPVLKSRTKNFEERISNKAKLLKSLRDKGVWLVDVSICALYDGGRKPSNHAMSRAIETSWSTYTKHLIETAEPEHVIVVGKGVARVVQEDLKNINGENYSVVDQPNARLSADEHLENFRNYYRLCNR
jgi:hypothetical protein